MFLSALLALVLIVLQFFLSRRLYRQIFRLFYHVTKNKNLSIKLLVIVLLPGTIVHELAHFFMATILGVRTGTINLIPTIKDDGQVIAGETQIAQCDPIRYSIIGLAPVVIGVIFIYSLSAFFLFKSIDLNFLFGQPLKGMWSVLISFDPLILFVVFLGFFWVSNTMFSSRKDLEAIIVPIILLYIIGFVLYFSGAKFSLPMTFFDQLGLFFSQLSVFMVMVLIINIGIFMLTSGLINLFSLLAKSK